MSSGSVNVLLIHIRLDLLYIRLNINRFQIIQLPLLYGQFALSYDWINMYLLYGGRGVIIRPSRNSGSQAVIHGSVTVSWPPEHVKNGSKQCLLSFLNNIDFFSGRFRNVIMFRIYQYLISHKKKSNVDFV